MSDLIVIEDLKAVAVFNENGLADVIAKIRDKVTSTILDVNKKKDRDLMRSNAANVAKAKGRLDELGKGLTEDWKKQAKVVDASRKSMREEMDVLRDEVRAPLTKWEDAEKERKANLEAIFQFIVDSSKAINAETELYYTLAELEANLTGLINVVVDDSLKEMELACIKAKQKSHDKLVNLIQAAKEEEAKQVEFERLQKESAEREQKERDARIASEAAENARITAELEAAKQQQESEAREASAKQATADAIQAKLDIEAQAKQDAIDADARSVQAKLDADALAKREFEAAESRLKQQREQADRDKQAAIDAEKARQKAEKQAEADALAKREANKAHKGRINKKAMQCFIKGGLSEDCAKQAVILLAKGVIDGAQINY